MAKKIAMKNKATKVLSCLVVIAILLSVVPVFKPEVSADAHTYVKNFKSEGIYVWGFSEAILTNNDEQKRFFELCKEEGIKTVFLSCDKTMLTTNPSIYADFIKKADVLQVHALDGNWDWAKDESNAEPFINAVLQYNSKTSYKFDGIHLDVEPGQGNFGSMKEFLNGYKNLLSGIKTKFSYSGETIKSQSMALSIDVACWWLTSQSRNEFKGLIGINDLDYITIMAYNDNANIVFSLAQGVVNVANAKSKPFVISLETQEFPGIFKDGEFIPDQSEGITFFEEGQSEFHKTLEQLQDRYKDNGLFKGFAIHFYQTSFTPWHIIESTKLPSGTFKPGDTVSVLVTLKTSDYFEDRPIAIGFSVRDDEGNVYPDDYIDDGLDVDTSKIILIKGIDKETVELEWTVPNFASGGNYDLTISVWDIDYNYNRSMSLFHKSILLENYPGDITQIGMHELSKVKVNGLRKFVELDRVDWIKDLFFVTKEPQDFTPLDLCMVLDRSGSMGDSMGGKTKMQGVKEAATGVVNVLLPQDRVSIVSFSDTATANIDLTSNFNAVKTKINAINADGGTSFGAGLEAALDQFKDHGNPDHTPAILFMSDGEHNRAPHPDAYVTQCKNKGIPIFTVGFASSESEVDVTKLKKMAEETGGEYHFVSKNFNLQNIFLRLQHKASGWESVAAYVGEVDEGETITAGTFYVDPAIDDLRVTLNWPGSNLDLELFDPNGRQVDFSASNVIYSGDTKPEYVIIKDPQSGTWTAKVYGKSIGSSEEFYVLVTKYEPPSPLPPPKCKVQITSNPSLQDRPSIVHVNGNYYIAYQSHEKGYGIYIKEFDSNWKFKKKVEVASGSAYYDSPSLLFANNKLYVAYITNANGANANDYDVIVKEYNPSSLSCTKGAKYLTSLQSCQDLPALYYKDGYFYMAYQSWEKGDGDIFIKKFDSDLNMLKKVQVTSKSTLQDRPSITYANGYFYVAYFSEETGYYDIFVKRLDHNLNLASWKEQITTKSSYQSYPFITFVNNQFVISYASTESGTLGIYMKKYNSNWNFIEKTKVIDSSAYERRPSHTWDGSNFWISYVYNQGDSKDWNIFAIRPDSECGSVHYRGLE